MTLGADRFEDFLAAIRIAFLVEGCLVSLQRLLPLAGALLEQRSRRLADGRVGMHNEAALVAKAERPGLNLSALQRPDQHLHAAGLEIHGVRSGDARRSGETAPFRDKHLAYLVAADFADRPHGRGLHLIRL